MVFLWGGLTLPRPIPHASFTACKNPSFILPYFVHCIIMDKTLLYMLIYSSKLLWDGTIWSRELNPGLWLLLPVQGLILGMDLSSQALHSSYCSVWSLSPFIHLIFLSTSKAIRTLCIPLSTFRALVADACLFKQPILSPNFRPNLTCIHNDNGKSLMELLFTDCFLNSLVIFNVCLRNRGDMTELSLANSHPGHPQCPMLD